jgi:hypothetical protein
MANNSPFFACRYDPDDEHSELSPRKAVVTNEPRTHLERRQAEQRRAAATSLRGSADDKSGAYRDLQETEAARLLDADSAVPPPPSSHEVRNRTNLRIARWLAKVALALEGAAEPDAEEAEYAEEEELAAAAEESAAAVEGNPVASDLAKALKHQRKDDARAKKKGSDPNGPLAGRSNGKPGFFSKAVGSQVSKKLRGKDELATVGWAPIDDDKGLADLERQLLKSKKLDEKHDKGKKGLSPTSPAAEAGGSWGAEAEEVHGKSVYSHLKTLVDDAAIAEQVGASARVLI